MVKKPLLALEHCKARVRAARIIRAVIRRRTTRLSDNALIDDVDLNAPNRKSVLFRRIPGPMDTGKCGQYNSELARVVKVRPTARELSFNDDVLKFCRLRILAGH